jgi:hypothetical protein
MKSYISDLLRITSVAFFVAFSSAALAQNNGTVTSHAFAVGKGPGTQGFTAILCASAQIAVGQSAADPICRTLSGDVTLSAAGVTAIGANKVTLGMRATGTQDTALGYWGSSAESATAIPNCTNALNYSTSTHSWSCNTLAGTGTLTSVSTSGLASGGPITSTGTVTVTAASQSDEQTGTSSTVATTPSQQQSHDSALKAWAFATVSGTNVTIPANSSYNVSGISRTSAGIFTVSFTTPFGSANYPCTADATGGIGTVFAANTGTRSRAAGSISLDTFQATSFANTDPVNMSIKCAGRQ